MLNLFCKNISEGVFCTLWLLLLMRQLSQKPHSGLFHKCHCQSRETHFPGPITGDDSGNTMLRFSHKMYIGEHRMVSDSSKGGGWIHTQKGFCQVEEAGSILCLTLVCISKFHWCYLHHMSDIHPLFWISTITLVQITNNSGPVSSLKLLTNLHPSNLFSRHQSCLLKSKLDYVKSLLSPLQWSPSALKIKSWNLN